MADPELDDTAAVGRAILDRRAVELARRAETADDRVGLELLFARAGGETFALETRFVRDIIEIPPISPVPDLSAVFLGVVSHVGEILPVVDLLALLGVGRTEGARILVVIGDGRPDVANAVAEADRVERVTDLAPAPAHSSLVLGVHDGSCLVLDGAALLAAPRLLANPEPA